MSSKTLAQGMLKSTMALDSYGKLESFLRAIISEGIDIDNPEDWVNKIGVEREVFIKHMLKLSNRTKQNPAIVSGEVITPAALKFLEEINAEIPEYLTKPRKNFPVGEKERPVRIDTGGSSGYGGDGLTGSLLSCRRLAARIMTSPDPFGDCRGQLLPWFIQSAFEEGIDLSDRKQWRERVGYERDEFIKHILMLQGLTGKPFSFPIFGAPLGVIEFFREIHAELSEETIKWLGDACLVKLNGAKRRSSIPVEPEEVDPFSLVDLNGNPFRKAEIKVIQVRIMSVTECQQPSCNRSEEASKFTAVESARIYGMPSDYLSRVTEVQERHPGPLVVVFERVSFNPKEYQELARRMSAEEVGRELLGGNSSISDITASYMQAGGDKSSIRVANCEQQGLMPRDYVDDVGCRRTLLEIPRTDKRCIRESGYPSAGSIGGLVEVFYPQSLQVRHRKPMGACLNMDGRCAVIMVRKPV